MAERKNSSIPPEELHGAVQVVTEDNLAKLRALLQGKQFDEELLTTGHDSQAGTWVSYAKNLLFLEADSPEFDSVQAIKKLLGLT